MQVVLDLEQLRKLATSAIIKGEDAALLEFATGPLNVELVRCSDESRYEQK